jgi:hypothetical protein
MTEHEQLDANLKALKDADPWKDLPEEERQRLCNERTKKLQDAWWQEHLQRLLK